MEEVESEAKAMALSLMMSRIYRNSIKPEKLSSYLVRCQNAIHIVSS